MNEKSCAPTCRAGNWDSIDWNKARAYVKKLQMRIVRVSLNQRIFGNSAENADLRWRMSALTRYCFSWIPMTER